MKAKEKKEDIQALFASEFKLYEQAEEKFGQLMISRKSEILDILMSILPAETGIVAQVCNCNSWETKTGWSSGHHGLCSETLPTKKTNLRPTTTAKDGQTLKQSC